MEEGREEGPQLPITPARLCATLFGVLWNPMLLVGNGAPPAGSPNHNYLPQRPQKSCSLSASEDTPDTPKTHQGLPTRHTPPKLKTESFIHPLQNKKRGGLLFCPTVADGAKLFSG